MKHSFGITVFFLMIFLFCAPGCWGKKNRIYGTWELVNNKNNQPAAPQSMSNRIQTFNKNKTFESHIKTPNGMIRTNSGVFFVLNDTTLVTYHEVNGKTLTVANSYNISIKNDSLHFYGYYLRPLPQNNAMLYMIYIDEMWVRSRIR